MDSSDPLRLLFFINSSKKEDIQSRATKANSICENIRHVYEDLEAHIKEDTDSKLWLIFMSQYWSLTSLVIELSAPGQTIPMRIPLGTLPINPY